MRTEYQDKLHACYPQLYIQKPCFECGCGWYKLIDQLSVKLEIMITALKIKDGVKEIADDDPRLPIYCVQCKEKYGGLRFYMSVATDEMYELIDHVEVASEKTCEDCGGVGESYQEKGWIMTLCKPCIIERLSCK